ncbi:aminoacyl-tRNA hydrolase [Pisciglobus halotolerans]|uniref:Peptidyl-tRNA hydrolase n=1 Tax=Pisciglobus halotolerans TaxID=745365 RepID=A0A1I3D450_9LACT|nr:aminoacyl-tRNA hydrolase [Pisciglobus halotolerans]SFH81477.1 peptidyl-tRNA hydrolase [Pisciglobus halotolerans]
MKMIVGLGNPGAKYRDTKHNIGFITLDEMAYQHGAAFNKTKFESVYAEARINREKVLLVKPQTFMNDSGRAVRPLMDYYDIALEDLLVIYDDLDLPVGKIRLRQKGSAGGHNGIKSMIQHIGTQDFNRIRIGIDRPMPGQTVVQHVLSSFPKDQHAPILEAVKTGASAADYWLEGHTFLDTMSHYN